MHDASHPLYSIIVMFDMLLHLRSPHVHVSSCVSHNPTWAHTYMNYGPLYLYIYLYMEPQSRVLVCSGFSNATEKMNPSQSQIRKAGRDVSCLVTDQEATGYVHTVYTQSTPSTWYWYDVYIIYETKKKEGHMLPAVGLNFIADEYLYVDLYITSHDWLTWGLHLVWAGHRFNFNFN